MNKTLGIWRQWCWWLLFWNATASSSRISSIWRIDFLLDFGLPLKTNILNALPSEFKCNFSSTFCLYFSCHHNIRKNNNNNNTNMTKPQMHTTSLNWTTSPMQKVKKKTFKQEPHIIFCEICLFFFFFVLFKKKTSNITSRALKKWQLERK